MRKQADLGELIGTMPPMKPVRLVRHKQPHWIEKGSAVMLAYVGVTVFSLMIALAVWMAFMFARQPSLA